MMSRLLALAALVVVGAAPAAAEKAQLALVLDASGSMWGQIEGENKIVIARRVLGDVLQTVPAETGIGLVAYGHRHKGDCDDIETIVPYGSTDRAALAAKIDALDPKGKTPITATLSQVFGDLRNREDATTVVLVSDGLETCGGDPCQAVRDAKQAGIEFVMHVVGFDLGEDEDISQLECAALAGDGLYLTAANADELGRALEQAIEITPETPTGKLSIKTVAEGALTDAMVEVIDPEKGEIVTAMRTYEHAETNPRVIPLPDGTYDVAVEAVGISGRPSQRLKGIEISAGKTVEKQVDFGTGRIRVKATRNGALSDVTVNVYRAGTRTFVVGGRTYRSDSSNPLEKEIVGGVYDVEIKGIEIANQPVHRWENIELAGDNLVELEHDFTSGVVKAGARHGDDLVDAIVAFKEEGRAVTQSRTYTSASSNPKAFVLSPGSYRLHVRPIKKDYGERILDIDVGAATEQTHIVDFATEEKSD